MEFKQAMRVFNRICKGHEMCEGCVLENKCIVLTECDFAEAEDILAKWAEKHPAKTIADDFFEKHPKARREDDDMPKPCAADCGYIDKCNPGEMSCAECWRRPLEEVE